MCKAVWPLSHFILAHFIFTIFIWFKSCLLKQTAKRKIICKDNYLLLILWRGESARLQFDQLKSTAQQTTTRNQTSPPLASQFNFYNRFHLNICNDSLDVYSSIVTSWNYNSRYFRVLSIIGLTEFTLQMSTIYLWLVKTVI